MDYAQILKYFLSTSIITAGLVYLSKVIIDKFGEARIENYKKTLQQDTENFRHNLNLQTDKFRHELSTASIEHQIKYTKLYEERGQIIKLTYNQLFELENLLASVTTMLPLPEWVGDTEREKKAVICIQALRKQLEQNRIFFSEKLCDEIEYILEESNNVIKEMIDAKVIGQRNEALNRSGRDLSNEELLKPFNIRDELDEKVKNEIKAARLSLAQEFRKLIGVS